MITANITIKGTNKVKTRMEKNRVRLTKNKAAYQKAVIVIDRWIIKNFEQEGRPTGEAWPELAESTIASFSRRRSGKGHKILHGDTGDLRTNWKHWFTTARAIVRSKTPYAIYHDSDEPRTSNLPRRQIIPDEKHIIAQITKIFGKFVRSNLR